MYLFYDTETNGLFNFKKKFDDPTQPRIVQLAAQLVDSNRKVRGELNVLIKPDKWTISADTTAIHGIHTEDCEKYGVPIKQALAMFHALVRGAGLPNSPDYIQVEYDSGGFMVAHNEKFDTGMLRAEYWRMLGNKMNGLPYSSADGFAKFCTMMKSMSTVRAPRKTGNGIKWPSLAEAVTFFLKRKQSNAHDAMGDVIDCRDVFFAMQDYEKKLL